MRKLHNALFSLLVVALPGTASSAPLSDDVFFVGHSLTELIPRYVQEMVQRQGGKGISDRQIIIGAPLRVNWTDSATAQGKDSRALIPQGGYEALVITEAIPLLNHITWNDSDGYALKFFNLMHNARPDGRVYLYETWHCTTSGTPTGCSYDNDDSLSWRDRLTNDWAKWKSIVKYVNNNNPAGAKNMFMVPAGQAMAKIYDEIAAGRVPGVTNISQLFAPGDDIHLSRLGVYYVSLVHYVTVYQRNPSNLVTKLYDEYGNLLVDVPTATADKMKALALETVCDRRRRTGVPKSLCGS